MDKIKKWGIHHGLIVFIISWALCFMYAPSIGIIASTALATGYVFKEYNEAQWRGFRLLDSATWKAEYFQWMDFITPCLVAAFNVWIMNGM